jgi:hypothetical protein
MVAAKQNNFVDLALTSKSGSMITDQKLTPAWNDILLNLPLLWSQPSPSRCHFIPAIFCFVSLHSKTLFILLMLLESIILFRMPAKKDVPLLLFCFSFTLITFTFVGLTTPVAGTLVRYKIAALPFLVFLTGYFISNSRLFVKNNAVQAV